MLGKVVIQILTSATHLARLSCPCPCSHAILSYQAFQRQTWGRSTSLESEWWEVCRKILLVLWCVVALKMIFHSIRIILIGPVACWNKILNKGLPARAYIMLWYQSYSATHTTFVFYGIFHLYYCRLSIQLNWGCKMAAVGAIHWRAEEPYSYFFLLSSSR